MVFREFNSTLNSFSLDSITRPGSMGIISAFYGTPLRRCKSIGYSLKHQFFHQKELLKSSILTSVLFCIDSSLLLIQIGSSTHGFF